MAKNEWQGQSPGSPDPNASTRFQTYLDEHPDTRCELVQRLQTFPGYQVWLEQFNPNLLETLKDARCQ